MSNTNNAMSTVVLANVCELTYAVFTGVAGNDISNSIDGQAMSREMVNDIVLAQVNNGLSKSMNGA